MSSLFRTVVLAALLGHAALATAADSLAGVIADQQLHGYATPRAALDRLLAVALPPDATQDLRRRQAATVASLAIDSADQDTADRALGQLLAMADQEACRPCRSQWLALLTHRADANGEGPDRLRERLATLTAEPNPASVELQFEIAAQRAAALVTLGEGEGAVDAATSVAALAGEWNQPAAQVRAFELLARARLLNSDASGAVDAAAEGYTLARRIGYGHMMILLRRVEAQALGRKGDSSRQHAALLESVALSHGRPGLQDLEALGLFDLAMFHAQRQEHEPAADYARRAEELAADIGRESLRHSAMATRAGALARLGQKDAAVKLIEQAAAGLGSRGLTPELAAVVAQQVEVLELADMPQAALQALRKLGQLQDEIMRDSREKAAQALQGKFSAERKSQEIEQLRLKAERSQAELSARTSHQRLVAAGAVALLLAAAALAQWLANVRQRSRTLQVDNALLSQQSTHDPLTGAFNRLHAEALMAQQQAQLQQPAAERSRDRNYHAGVGLMLLDIDHFKRVNDSHGHAAGDEVIKAVARRLQALVREHDAVVRWGGEEFLILLPGTGAEGGAVFAERALRCLGAEPVEIGEGQRIAVTASAGFVAWPAWPGQAWDEAVHVADMALYLSKNEGRNRATCLARVDPGAQIERILADLAAGRDHGDAVLASVAGPRGHGSTEGRAP